MFECEKCGKCCHQFGITLSVEDIAREPRLKEHMIPVHRVGNPKTRVYMIEKKLPFVLTKSKRGGPCVFLLNNMCLIYETRPEICRTFECKG